MNKKAQMTILEIGNRMRQNYGFTLIEIMITISIIAIGMILIIQAYSLSLKVLKLSSEFIQAVLLAEQKLWNFERVSFKNRILSEFDHQSYVIENQNFNYTFKRDNTDEAMINQLKLDISWTNDGALKNLEVITYLKRK